MNAQTVLHHERLIEAPSREPYEPTHRGRTKRNRFMGLIVVGIGIAIASVAVYSVRRSATQRNAELVATKTDNGFRLVAGDQNTLEFSPEALVGLKIHTARVRTPRAPDPLRMSGSLFVDSNRLVHVHTRFAGEVVEIGTVNDAETSSQRQLRVNDVVQQGQLLAVIWSKEVGEKKSDLVDALSQFRLHQANLDRLKRLEPGVVPERTILEAERSFEADQIAVDRVERTLRSWRLSDEEINAVKAESLQIHQGRPAGKPNDNEVDRQWAQIEIRAPLHGVVLEKNLATGDIVDTNLDLFKIADLSKLAVLANVYEEDIPSLSNLPQSARQWEISLKAEPDSPRIQGRFEIIGSVIDPRQHTATVIGWVDNQNQQLRIGQFITATVALPPPSNELAVPVDAVIDRGSYSTVLVADETDSTRVTERRVSVARRRANETLLRSNLSETELAQGIRPLKVNELVVTTGNIEISAALQELRSQSLTNQVNPRGP